MKCEIAMVRDLRTLLCSFLAYFQKVVCYLLWIDGRNREHVGVSENQNRKYYEHHQPYWLMSGTKKSVVDSAVKLKLYGSFSTCYTL